MAHLIVEEDVIGVLTSKTLPDGSLNPFEDLNDFLVATQGWKRQSEKKSEVTRQDMERILLRESAPPAPSSVVLYMTGSFTPSRLALPNFIAAKTLFDAYGLFFELVRYPAFIALDEAAYAAAVPTYLPNSTRSETENGEELSAPISIPVPWSEWKSPKHTHTVVDSINYVPTSGFGEHLCGTVLKQLVQDSYNVKSMEEWPESSQEVE